MADQSIEEFIDEVLDDCFPPMPSPHERLLLCKIQQLAAENNKLREAIDNINKAIDSTSLMAIVIRNIINALKGKETK